MTLTTNKILAIIKEVGTKLVIGTAQAELHYIIDACEDAGFDDSPAEIEGICLDMLAEGLLKKQTCIYPGGRRVSLFNY